MPPSDTEMAGIHEQLGKLSAETAGLKEWKTSVDSTLKIHIEANATTAVLVRSLAEQQAKMHTPENCWFACWARPKISRLWIVFTVTVSLIGIITFLGFADDIGKWFARQVSAAQHENTNHEKPQTD